MRIALAACAVAILGTYETAQAEITDRHREVTQEVFDRLIAVVDQPEGWDVWPPILKVTDNDEVQALAYPLQTDEGYTPHIEVYSGLIERIAEFNPEVLAFIVGHEIGHLVYFHGNAGVERAKRYGAVRVATAVQAAGRDEEHEADLFGMQVALKAGYSHQGVRRALINMAKTQDTVGDCSFQGLRTSHPSWDLRAVFLQQDDVQRELWRSVVAFRNGVLFLETENYIHAEFCFRRVCDEFPECYEGWANLGYALLMQYADALDEDDLRAFDIGHLVVGGFYRRPESLSAQIRAIDEDLWFEAVGAFREALRLKERLAIDDDMIAVKANLAVAYLIHPSGKQVGEAERYFTEVLDLLDRPENADSLDPLVRATVLVNASAGRPLEAERLAQATKLLEQLVVEEPTEKSRLKSLAAALDYSQTFRFVNSSDRADQLSAYEALERYLGTISTASSWWPLAYSKYEALAAKLGEDPKQQDDFKQPTIDEWRPVTSIAIDGGEILGLAQLCDDVLPHLGEATAVTPVIPGTNLKRHHYADRGLSVLGSRDVLAIFLESESAPPIVLARPGVGGDVSHLKVGMERSELERLLGDEWAVQFASIDDPETVYQLYRDVGVAVRFKEDRVDELVIVLVPRKS